MLVLRRLTGESIDIFLPNGDVVRVKVSEIGRGYVRLGFVAPQDVRIVRDDANPQHAPATELQ